MTEPRLIDAHSHINFFAFKDDTDETIERALAEGVWVVNAGSQFETSRRAVEIAENYSDGVYAVVGLHPVHLFSHHVDEEESSFDSREEEFSLDTYRELILRSDKVVGVGECGLEYYDVPGVSFDDLKAKEIDVFKAHIKLALDLDRTLVVHSRDTYADVFEVLKSAEQRPERILIHSFIGNWGEAKKFLSFGCFFSLNGIITYKPSKEKKPGRSDPGLLEAIKNIPLENITLETDAPYLAPEPVRGKRNEPAFVKYVAERIAVIKEVDAGEVEEVTTANARKLFRI